MLGLCASGSRAAVYDALDLREGSLPRPVERVVVKVVRCEGPTSEAAVALACEGQLLRSVPQEIAPRWLGQGCDVLGDEPPCAAFIACERAGGERLVSSELSVLERARRAARALAALHAAGIVHGVPTPDHVFVEPIRALATLVDFGSAARDGQPPARLAATPAYAAPELWRTGPTRAADVYALGCALFRVVSGRPPFMAQTLDGLRRQHQQASPPELPGGCGELLARVISAAMSKEAAHRPADGAALARALEG